MALPTIPSAVRITEVTITYHDTGDTFDMTYKGEVANDFTAVPVAWTDTGIDITDLQLEGAHSNVITHLLDEAAPYL